MKTVASTDHYVIEVDESKNRLHFRMKGSWTDAAKVPAWLGDVSKALTHLSPGFTELIDWTEVGAITLTDYIAGAQDLAMKAGLRKAARLYTEERFLKTQMDVLSQKTGFPVKSFFDRAEAEAWLDSA
jgi:hypothetical protein